MTKTDVEIQPNPQLERRTRRRFSEAEKQRLLSKFEQLAHGDQGAWPPERAVCRPAVDVAQAAW